MQNDMSGAALIGFIVGAIFGLGVMLWVQIADRNVKRLSKPAPDEYVLTFAVPIGPWFQWFAWRPVHTVDRGTVWLRYIWKRRIQKKLLLPGPDDQWFQYVVEGRHGS